MLLEKRIRLNAVDSEPVAILGPGEIVGKLSIIDQQPTSAFVAAKAIQFLGFSVPLACRIR